MNFIKRFLTAKTITTTDVILSSRDKNKITADLVNFIVIPKSLASIVADYLCLDRLTGTLVTELLWRYEYSHIYLITMNSHDNRIKHIIADHFDTTAVYNLKNNNIQSSFFLPEDIDCSVACIISNSLNEIYVFYTPYTTGFRGIKVYDELGKELRKFWCVGMHYVRSMILFKKKLFIVANKFNLMRSISTPVIRIYNSISGRLIKNWRQIGNYYYFKTPTRIRLYNNEIFVYDKGHNSVFVFNTNLKLLRELNCGMEGNIHDFVVHNDEIYFVVRCKNRNTKIVTLNMYYEKKVNKDFENFVNTNIKLKSIFICDDMAYIVGKRLHDSDESKTEEEKIFIIQ
jgi:hypothetical protein